MDFSVLVDTEPGACMIMGRYQDDQGEVMAIKGNKELCEKYKGITQKSSSCSKKTFDDLYFDDFNGGDVKDRLSFNIQANTAGLVTSTDTCKNNPDYTPTEGETVDCSSNFENDNPSTCDPIKCIYKPANTSGNCTISGEYYGTNRDIYSGGSNEICGDFNLKHGEEVLSENRNNLSNIIDIDISNRAHEDLNIQSRQIDNTPDTSTDTDDEVEEDEENEPSEEQEEEEINDVINVYIDDNIYSIDELSPELVQLLDIVLLEYNIESQLHYFKLDDIYLKVDKSLIDTTYTIDIFVLNIDEINIPSEDFIEIYSTITIQNILGDGITLSSSDNQNTEYDNNLNIFQRTLDVEIYNSIINRINTINQQINDIITSDTNMNIGITGEVEDLRSDSTEIMKINIVITDITSLDSFSYIDETNSLTAVRYILFDEDTPSISDTNKYQSYINKIDLLLPDNSEITSSFITISIDDQGPEPEINLNPDDIFSRIKVTERDSISYDENRFYTAQELGELYEDKYNKRKVLLYDSRFPVIDGIKDCSVYNKDVCDNIHDCSFDNDTCVNDPEKEMNNSSIHDVKTAFKKNTGNGFLDLGLLVSLIFIVFNILILLIHKNKFNINDISKKSAKNASFPFWDNGKFTNDLFLFKYFSNNLNQIYQTIILIIFFVLLVGGFSLLFVYNSNKTDTDFLSKIKNNGCFLTKNVNEVCSGKMEDDCAANNDCQVKIINNVPQCENKILKTNIMSEKMCNITNSIMNTYYVDNNSKLEWIDAGDKECTEQKRNCLDEGKNCSVQTDETQCNAIDKCKWDGSNCDFDGLKCSEILSQSNSSDFNDKCSKSDTCTSYTTCKEQSKDIIYDLEKYIIDNVDTKSYWIMNSMFFLLFFIIIYCLIDIYLEKDNFKLNNILLGQLLRTTITLLPFTFILLVFKVKKYFESGIIFKELPKVNNYATCYDIRGNIVNCCTNSNTTGDRIKYTYNADESFRDNKCIRIVNNKEEGLCYYDLKIDDDGKNSDTNINEDKPFPDTDKCYQDKDQINDNPDILQIQNEEMKTLTNFDYAYTSIHNNYNFRNSIANKYSWFILILIIFIVLYLAITNDYFISLYTNTKEYINSPERIKLKNILSSHKIVLFITISIPYILNVFMHWIPTSFGKNFIQMISIIKYCSIFAFTLLIVFIGYNYGWDNIKNTTPILILLVFFCVFVGIYNWVFTSDSERMYYLHYFENNNLIKVDWSKDTYATDTQTYDYLSLDSVNLRSLTPFKSYIMGPITVVLIFIYINGVYQYKNSINMSKINELEKNENYILACIFAFFFFIVWQSVTTLRYKKVTEVYPFNDNTIQQRNSASASTADTNQKYESYAIKYRTTTNEDSVQQKLFIGNDNELDNNGIATGGKDYFYTGFMQIYYIYPLILLCLLYFTVKYKSSNGMSFFAILPVFVSLFIFYLIETYIPNKENIDFVLSRGLPSIIISALIIFIEFFIRLKKKPPNFSERYDGGGLLNKIVMILNPFEIAEGNGGAFKKLFRGLIVFVAYFVMIFLFIRFMIGFYSVDGVSLERIDSREINEAIANNDMTIFTSCSVLELKGTTCETNDKVIIIKNDGQGQIGIVKETSTNTEDTLIVSVMNNNRGGPGRLSRETVREEMAVNKNNLYRLNEVYQKRKIRDRKHNMYIFMFILTFIYLLISGSYITDGIDTDKIEKIEKIFQNKEFKSNMFVIILFYLLHNLIIITFIQDKNLAQIDDSSLSFASVLFWPLAYTFIGYLTVLNYYSEKSSKISTAIIRIISPLIIILLIGTFVWLNYKFYSLEDNDNLYYKNCTDLNLKKYVTNFNSDTEIRNSDRGLDLYITENYKKELKDYYDKDDTDEEGGETMIDKMNVLKSHLKGIKYGVPVTPRDNNKFITDKLLEEHCLEYVGPEDICPGLSETECTNNVYSDDCEWDTNTNECKAIF